MENSFIYSSANVFKGGVSIGSYSSEEFISKNTTTFYGKREVNLQRKERMDTNVSQSFSSCEWVECTAPQGGALNVHENENATLTVENSSFTRCYASSTRGGGIYALKTAECVDIHSVFVQCAAEETTDFGGGGINFEIIYSHKATNRVCANYHSNVDHSEWLHNDFGNVRFVSSTDSQPKGIDTYAYGLDESYPCSTISRCLTQLISGFGEEIKVLYGTITQAVSVDGVSTSALTVRNLALAHRLEIADNCYSKLFEISSAGNIHISRLNVSAGSGHFTETEFSTELINVQGGILHMESVNWVKAYPPLR
ncbi:uncharacterized protein MONOS_14962 [Monocercomonoides exilis]|uniref:uncharacterized protein n=1 Tax=Monocercomonoides exilis TaxID=2049356 RepID=UPI00355A0E60|nr:hypothetical protein MONOS_14962 [Monocercomonoides exilis]|eukprot:MONOS_14962.1-p1 / transcript=MONOS_14962.1 / gene=MONOS_14962 / organism=Monocercomonoides_exilis_PA203 / gene_product=unspecified product / transcript_product=unspecified product / location=Mono_scaffold01116:1137-2560(+) / protein_length=311 / sequence_SO=supercontig / SO=protein_coding / is_pseudo=false